MMRKTLSWGKTSLSASIFLTAPLLALSISAISAEGQTENMDNIEEVVIVSSRYPVPLNEVV